MKRYPIRMIAGILLLVSILILPFLYPVQAWINMPTSLTLIEGQEETFASFGGEVVEQDNAIEVTAQNGEQSISAGGVGQHEMVYELAGFPIKKVNVDVVKDLKVYPGGQSIGVKLNTLGVLVVGHHLVETGEGRVSPGENAGIEVGDIITKINGTKVEKMSDIGPYVKQAGENGKPLQLEVRREEETFETELMPIQQSGEAQYKLGLYIRDSAAGIGTMTFYEPKSKKYGALGHVISDMDTKEPIVVQDGEIMRSMVTSIEKGRGGNPGEKLARFAEDKKVIGNIKRNSPFGIFGELTDPIQNGILDEPMSIALSHQVKEGPAQILTVVDDDKVELFDIEIISTIPQKFPATKGMVIKVTDPRLLEKTGGIVQGMSGSPIVQDGKLVGAVTHVFVNDPKSGYGVHIEWMLDEAGIDLYGNDLNQAS